MIMEFFPPSWGITPQFVNRVTITPGLPLAKLVANLSPFGRQFFQHSNPPISENWLRGNVQESPQYLMVTDGQTLGFL